MVITDAIAAFAAYYVVAFLSLLIGVSAKWIVMGRRSSYCQRWQLYITLQSMQSGLLGAIRGSHYLVAYFRGLGCKIGEHPMMTEPDLITIGSHTVIDQASVLKIGESCVLRTDSRLLEHTLIVGGEVVDAGRMMQGWPAKEVDMEEPERGRQGTMRRKVTVPERIIARS
ncbi:hypothetical protein BDR26DRAFT_870149 [Obelidium mucronatum]|nr:hypothetical protein BDR26DRAFT_870149 [Obelidium mucronatum]